MILVMTAKGGTAMAQKGQLAYDCFFKGHNCAQCVAMAFAPELGVTPQRAAQLAAGFGGGFGRMREVCGAFSGAVLVLGALYGSADPAQKTALYGAVQKLAARFAAENGKGSIVCRELLGLQKGENAGPEATPRTPEFYQKRPCPALIRLAADLTEQYIAEHPIQNTGAKP